MHLWIFENNALLQELLTGVLIAWWLRKQHFSKAEDPLSQLEVVRFRYIYSKCKSESHEMASRNGFFLYF